MNIDKVIIMLIYVWFLVNVQWWSIFRQFYLLGFVKINIISYWKEIWNGFDDGEAICSIDVYPFLAFSTWKRILYLLFSYHHGCKHYFLLHVHCERYPGITGYILHLYVSLDVCIFLHDVVMKCKGMPDISIHYLLSWLIG